MLGFKFHIQINIYIIPAILYNMEFICICCDFISKNRKKDSICDFTSGMCGHYVCNFIFVSTYVCLWLEYLLKITFGAALPSKSIWLLCTFALDLSCMCYYKLRNAIWSLHWYFQIIIVAFLPFDWVRYGLLYNECLLVVPKRIY